MSSHKYAAAAPAHASASALTPASIVSDVNANIESQVLSTDAHLGYLIMDLNDRDLRCVSLVNAVTAGAAARPRRMISGRLRRILGSGSW